MITFIHVHSVMITFFFTSHFDNLIKLYRSYLFVALAIIMCLITLQDCILGAYFICIIENRATVG